MLTLSSFALTHPGRVRESNEDAVLVTDRLAVVADGMGGHVAGEIASAMAVERMRELPRDTVAPDDIVAAVVDADRLIREAGAHDPAHAGMGTTLCGIALVDTGPRCLVFNVGDSRVYRLADGAFAQVSVDHSEVQELRDAGELDDVTARLYPRRNVITRCLGGSTPVGPDVWGIEPVGRERFLVCSDGLSGEVDDETIGAVLAANDAPEAAAGELLELALVAGGRDNISVIVADVGEAADPHAVPAAVSGTLPA